MRAFVTGSTGMLGQSLIPLLQEGGAEVRALARSEQKANDVLGTSVDRVLGDMENVVGFAPTIEGCDVLFHLAAHYRDYSGDTTDADLLERVNVAATIEVLEAARARGVRRIVFVSSAGVVDLSAGAPADEHSPYDAATDNLYFKSKARAEQAIDDFLSHHDDVDVVTVRPSLMLGPRDFGPTPAGRFVLNYLESKIPAVLPGRMALVDARDVASALVAAAAKGQRGARYLLAGEAHPLAEVMSTLERVSGVPCPKKRPPYWLAATLFRIGALLGKPIPFSPSHLRRMQTMKAPITARAERELGFQARPLEDTLGEAVAWFRSSEWVERAAANHGGLSR